MSDLTPATSFADFSQYGYQLVPADKPERLLELRRAIAAKARELVGGAADGDDAGFFDQFHQYGLIGTQLNDFRLAMIQHCSSAIEVDRMVYEAFEQPLLRLVGPDMVVQKTVNLVIQQPGDTDVAPIHRDAPLNSPFEIIVWLPLVNAYASKSMFVLDRSQSDAALAELRGPGGHQGYGDYAVAHGTQLAVPFGQACFFWPGLVHGCPVNQETETRWSLNIRYKNIFSPYGSKGLPDFFKILRLSPLAQIAFDFERQEYGRV